MNKKETEADIAAGLIVRLSSRGVVRQSDIFCGDSVYGADVVRRACESAQVENMSPLNEGNRNDKQRLIMRSRDAGIELIRRVFLQKDRHKFTHDDFVEYLEVFSEADMLLTISKSMLSEGTTLLGALREKFVRELSVVSVDLVTAIHAAIARNIRSARQEGFNGILKRPFGVVGLGGRATTRGYHRLKNLLLANILAIQILFLGGMSLH